MSALRVLLVGIIALEVACSKPPFVEPPVDKPLAGTAAPPDKHLEELQRYIAGQLFFEDLAKFVAIRTYRNADLTEEQVVKNLQELHDAVETQVQQFNQTQKVHKLSTFQWKKQTKEQEYWLFGVRLGTGSHRVALSSHLDTVPPGTQGGWQPFTLVKEQRSYTSGLQDFYVGRGAIDDKGPALVALNVLKAVARRYDGDPKLEGVTLELLFDTSKSKAPAQNLVRIQSLDTPKGPSNQIPDEATAVLTAESEADLMRFAGA